MSLFAPSRDFLLDVGFGLVSGYSRVSALGHNATIDVGSVPEDVWPGGGIFPWMTAAGGLEVVSSSAADAAAGTGARTVLVTGLDASYNAITETVTLNGTTAVALVNQYIAVNGAIVMTSGSGFANAGTLTIRDSGAGTTRSIIEIGSSITQQSQYTVPLGHQLQVLDFAYAVNRPSSARDAEITTLIRLQNGTIRLPFPISVDGNPHERNSSFGLVVAEKNSFGLRCSYVSQSGTNVVAGWQGILRRIS